jgi:hypothetical protein
VTLLLAYLALVVAVAAVCCGHQGEPFPPFTWWRAARAAGRSRGGLYGRWSALRARNALREGRPAHNAADGHQAPRAPADTPRAATDGPDSAPQPPDAPDTHRDAPKPHSARTHRPGPTWAQPDSEEAA